MSATLIKPINQLRGGGGNAIAEGGVLHRAACGTRCNVLVISSPVVGELPQEEARHAHPLHRCMVKRGVHCLAGLIRNSGGQHRIEIAGGILCELARHVTLSLRPAVAIAKAPR